MEAEQKLKDLKIKFLDMLSEINNTADQILTKRKNSEHLLSKENKNLRQNERETKSTQNHFFDYSEFSNKKHKFLERHFSQFTPKLSKPEKIVSENEKRILRDVLFVMQGINGDFFKINSSTNLAELKNDDIFQNKEFERISQTAIMASLECCECGIYYKNIVNVLNMKETGQILKV
ncbi:hypothetical protein MHBO_001603 [Bonamia ostreae]|uniref:Gamma tubulin complex component protein N-terminal domain-containing protein n=1 Tax=Bonamia ostreae TaxID=126728 RepID=A0ABV2AJK1_9EUKA